MTVSALLSIPQAAAAPPNAGSGAHITDIQHVNDRWDKVSVYSPAMDKVVVNDVLKSPRSGAPTFYLLPGIDGGDNLDPGANFAPGTKSWFGFTDLQGFFGNKNVNVVSPLGGQFSWYTDWVNDRSKQYQTYMTRELPPLINAQYKTNGKNAVGGLSSTGGTAVDYAIQAPGVYRAVGSYSGFLTPSAGRIPTASISRRTSSTTCSCRTPSAATRSRTANGPSISSAGTRPTSPPTSSSANIPRRRRRKRQSRRAPRSSAATTPMS